VSQIRIIAVICIAIVIAALAFTRRATVPDFHGARASEIATPGQGDYDEAGHDLGFFSGAIQVALPAHIAEGQTITLSYAKDGATRHDAFAVVRISAKKSLCRLYDRENAVDSRVPGKVISIKDCKVLR
jgi:hypothetical protein